MGRNGTPLQYSCLENPMDGGAWEAAAHGVAKSRTWLSDFTFTFHFYALEKEMATHSSVLAWRIPGMGSHRVGHDWSDLAAAVATSWESVVCLANTDALKDTMRAHMCLFCTILHLHSDPQELTISRDTSQSWCVDNWGQIYPQSQFISVCSLSCVWFFETPRAIAQQTPLSMEFSKQEHWSGLPFPSPRDLPNPGIEAAISCIGR